MSEPSHILYIEDNMDNQLLLSYYVKKEPYEITFASDGDQGLNVIKESDHHFDIVLVDWNLPQGISGVELIEAIRDVDGYAETPIVIITAHAKKDDLDDLGEYEIDRYLFKPVKKQDLLDLINDVE